MSTEVMAAYQRRSPQSRKTASQTALLPPQRKQYSLRATSRTYSHASTHDSSLPVSSDQRKPLLPLQPNLRHPSSRTFSQKGPFRDQDMREVGHVVGTKRKRVASTNENANTNGKSMRGLERLKRQRSNYHDRSAATSESEMDIDAASAQWSASDTSECGDEPEHEENSDEDEDDSKDEYYLHSAERDALIALKKADLVRLYELAGLGDDGEHHKKAELADDIISSREDIASLPPSSPPRGAASDYSSDDGNIAGDEETDVCPQPSTSAHALRRRATTTDFGAAAGRPLKGRSASMGNILYTGASHQRKAFVKINGEEAEGTRRQISNRSSSSTSSKSSIAHSSPLATRLRSRKASNASVPSATGSTGSNRIATRSKDKGKGKAKQVEFSDKLDGPIHRSTRSKDKERSREALANELAEESDLTELDELDETTVTSTPKPSPRRLRSKDREKQRKGGTAAPGSSSSRNSRTTRSKDSQDRLRESKAKGDELPGSDSEEMAEVDQLEDDDEMEVEEELAEDDEVDELDSSTAATPPPAPLGRQTPLRHRLRPRRREHVSPTGGDDGDDEDEGDEDEKVEDGEGEEEGENEDGDDEGEEQDENDGESEHENDDDDDEATIAVEPKRLRNGKIVGEEDIDMDEDIGEENEEDEEEDGEEEEDVEGDGDDSGAEAEEHEEEGHEEDAEGDVEEMEEDIDWAVVTKKKLMKLLRDDLVQLCQVRDIEPEGNKQRLVQALLQWRDNHTNNLSSPSSTGTARPPSTPKRRRKATRSHSGTGTPPILLRSEHVHMDEPRTPVPEENGKEKDEQDLELDLESLGLDGREIPPEKLTKLEKIGSGGFKDVFIGKFRGRKIAISEFRGQLSAMDIKELKLLGGFDHPNIVRFLGVSIPENTKETPVMIVSELCSNGDLFDYVRNVKPPSLLKVLHMMLDIARGLEYLHTRKPSIIHRDCKSSNILITARGNAKIADFGLAKVKQSTRSMVRSLVGTVNWQAPELWHPHPKYNYKVDVFSCAMVYWEMLQWHLPNKKFPWEGMNEHAIYDIVGAKRQRPSISSLRKQWCPEIVDLIERMWAHEHQDRPTMTEVVRELEEIADNYR